MSAGLPDFTQCSAFARVMESSEYAPETGCINCGLSIRGGYPRVKAGGRYFPAHRLALAEATHVNVSQLGRWQFSLHSCDNKRCVNPAHLRWGSARDNKRDALERRRDGQQMKTKCLRGHSLVGANLLPAHVRMGRRSCLVCSRALSAVRDAKRRGRTQLAIGDAIARELSRVDGGRDRVAADALREVE